MRKMTGFQRTVVGLAAVIVALRMFFPVTAPPVLIGGVWVARALLAPTLLHVVGVVVLAAAVFILFPSPSWRGSVWWLGTGSLLAGWLFYVAFIIAGLQVGIANSWNINWHAAWLAVGGLLILAMLTGLWTVARRRQTLTPIMKTLAGGVLVVGLLMVTMAMRAVLRPPAVGFNDALAITSPVIHWEDVDPEVSRLKCKEAHEALVRFRQKYPKGLPLARPSGYVMESAPTLPDKDLARIILAQYPQYEDLLGAFVAGLCD